MAKRQGRVFVPQLGATFESAQAAAAALNIDASNINKVLRGKRLSAGGFNFITVPENVAPEKLTDIMQAFDNIQDTQRRRQKKNRRPTATERAIIADRRAAAKELHAVLVDANKIIAQYAREGLTAYTSVIPELEEIKNIIGRNKRGLFNTDVKSFKKFSTEQIRAIAAAVERQTSRKYFRDTRNAADQRAAMAMQFGLTENQMDIYASMLPDLFEILTIAKNIQGLEYDTLPYDLFTDAAQRGADPEQLRRALDYLMARYKQLDNAINIGALTGDDIAADWDNISSDIRREFDTIVDNYDYDVDYDEFDGWEVEDW